MRTIKLRLDFDFSDLKNLNKLKKLGYSFYINEGGWVSNDGSTIIIEHREPYVKQVMCFNGNEKLYAKNIEWLKQFGLV